MLRPASRLGGLLLLGSLLAAVARSWAVDVDPGEILLGQFNCVACHAVPEPVRARLASKQAPVLGPGGVALTPQWLRAYLRDPQAAQPGTTMPNLLHGLPPAEREVVVESLTHYLLSRQTVPDLQPVEYDAAVETKGRELYHTVGCVACHAPQSLPANSSGSDAEARLTLEKMQANSAPLGDLASKTTVPQLAAFLKNPLATRPSGQMPSSKLDDAEATAIAMYLQRAQKGGDQPGSAPGLRYEYYEESLSNLPRFDRLRPKEKGIIPQINLSVTRRDDNVALRLRGNLSVPAAGDYTFTVLSDDGARLFVDDKQILENDGVHAATEAQGHLALTKGEHTLTVLYFNGTGERALQAYWQGPGFSRQEIPASVLSHAITPIVPVGTDPTFTVDAVKAERGRQLFASLGCVSCHGLERNAAPIAKNLADLDPQRPDACTAAHAAADRPQFALTDLQRAALSKTLSSQGALGQPLDPPTRVAHTMATLNCYACHVRDGHGGPEGTRRDYFSAVGEADLGDEGRFPPALDGAGGKLRPTALQAIFWQAAVARPYMATRMPQFGRANLEGLVGSLAQADNHDLGTPANDEPAPFPAAVAAGHKLAGTGGLGCIACHNFAGHSGLGIPAIDMTLMVDRLNPGWFRRYLLDPQSLRPGTRMPAFWPDGKASNTEILAGNTEQQIASLREYLAKGRSAELPDGLIPAKMELVARKEAVIYRNFITGVSPRAIGVGYPEKANLAFDADQVRLALLWQGGFIDASRHRTGRAQGNQPPLGGNVVEWTPGVPFARLPGPDAPWPTDTGKAAGYQFRGYRLDNEQRPTFLYTFDGVQVEDTPIAVPGQVDAGFRRTLRLQVPAGSAVNGLFFRAAVGGSIVKQTASNQGAAYLVDGKVTVTLTGCREPILRQENGSTELLAPLQEQGGSCVLEETLHW